MPETSADGADSGTGRSTVPDATAESVSRLCAVGLLAAGLFGSVGVVGVIVALAVGIVWWRAPSPFAFGIGQFGFVAVGGGLVSPAGIAAQLGLWGLLLVDVVAAERETGRWLWGVAAAAGGTAVFVSVAWVARTQFDPLWQAVAILSVLSAVVLYSIHRYQLVRMGLVGESA